jgi:hypothetical protein
MISKPITTAESRQKNKRGSSLAKDARRWGGGPLFANPSCVGASRRTKGARRKKPVVPQHHP